MGMPQHARHAVRCLPVSLRANEEIGMSGNGNIRGVIFLFAAFYGMLIVGFGAGW